MLQIIGIAASCHFWFRGSAKLDEEEKHDIALTWESEHSLKRVWDRPGRPPEAFTDNELALIKDRIERRKRETAEQKEKLSLNCFLANLGIPVLWAIGLFIGKGLPLKKHQA